jgi:hypothetical protein
MKAALTVLSLAFVGMLWVILDRFINPFLAKRRVARVLADRKHFDPRTLESEEYGSIALDEQAVTVSSKTGSDQNFLWSQVVEMSRIQARLVHC